MGIVVEEVVECIVLGRGEGEGGKMAKVQV